MRNRLDERHKSVRKDYVRKAVNVMKNLDAGNLNSRSLLANARKKLVVENKSIVKKCYKRSVVGEKK